MKTDKGLDMMVKCLPDIEALQNSDYAKKCKEEGKPVDVVGLLAGPSREHLYNIIAAATEKTVDEVKEQELSETFKAVGECMNGGFYGFFILLQRMASTM